MVLRRLKKMYRYIIEANDLIRDLQKEWLREWLLDIHTDGRLDIYIGKITQLEFKRN